MAKRVWYIKNFKTITTTRNIYDEHKNHLECTAIQSSWLFGCQLYILKITHYVALKNHYVKTNKLTSVKLITKFYSTLFLMNLTMSS